MPQPGYRPCRPTGSDPLPVECAGSGRESARMLTDEQKTTIGLEEAYRAEVRDELASRQPKGFLITYEPHVPGSTPAREPDSGH